MRLTKISVRLAALAAAVFAVMLALGSMGHAPRQEAEAVGPPEILPSVACADIWQTRAGETRPPKGAPADPAIQDLVGKSLTRIEPAQGGAPNEYDIVSVSYFGPDQKGGDEPLTDPLDLIADKPPTVDPCQPKKDQGLFGPEASLMNPQVKFQTVSGMRPTPTATYDAVSKQLTWSTCDWSEESKLWIKTDVNTVILGSGPNAKNFGTLDVYYGTDSPASAMDKDGDTKPDHAADPSQCTGGIEFNSTIEIHDRNPATDHPLQPKNLGIPVDPDGPQPKIKGIPQNPDSADGLADDWDGDGCPDWDELDKDFINGRDPFNPNDCDWNYTGSYNILATVQAATVDEAGIYYHCIAAIDHDQITNALDGAMQCYADSPDIAAAGGSAVPTYADGNAGPPPPPPYTTADPIQLNGVYDKVTDTLTLDGCLEDIGGILGPNIIVHAEIDAKSLKGYLDGHPKQGNAACDAKTPKNPPGSIWEYVKGWFSGPLVMSEQGIDFDHDKDGCSDYEELMQTNPAAKCGDDPYNPYDSDANFDSVSSMLITLLRQDICQNGVPSPDCEALPDGTQVPGAYYHCISDTQHNPDNTLDVKVLCYIDSPYIGVNPEEYGDYPTPGCCGDGAPDSPPPPPFADIDDNHTDLHGVHNKITNRLEISGCFVDKDGQSYHGNMYWEADVDARTGQGNVTIWPNETWENCLGKTPKPGGKKGTVPIEITEQGPKTPKVPGAKVWDTDQDGCSDAEELGEDRAAGGLRDPYNRWDFYDVWSRPVGDPDAWERNASIDLFGDIFGVAFRFGASGDPNGDPLVPPTDETSYHTAFDRGGSLVGSNLWNRKPPDGEIDLFNDIFGVAYQFGHDCTAAP